MADRTSFVTRRKKTWGDVAVDGLLVGLVAGLIMGILLILLGLLEGVGPVEMFARFDPAGSGAVVAGGLMHLAVSGIYGVLLALLFYLIVGPRPWLWRYSLALGIGFGLVLWLAARAIFLPAMNLGLAQIGSWEFALAHAVYGAALGYLLRRYNQ